MIKEPVFPIIPCFTENEDFDLNETMKYAFFLVENGVTRLMTTAGTTQFNLMTASELVALNNRLNREIDAETIVGAPTLNKAQLIEFIGQSLEGTDQNKTCSVLVTYPERYYSNEEVATFFSQLEHQISPAVNVYIHGLPMKDGIAGTKEFDWPLIECVLTSSSNIRGMKEECSSYELGFTLCASKPEETEYEFIVAGGSMRRFLLLGAAGAQSFFAGVGSLLPRIELSFIQHYREGRLPEILNILRTCETPTFDVFMSMGWHKALRYAAKKMGIISTFERSPLGPLDPYHRSQLDRSILRLEQAYAQLEREGVLV